jgi:hypothetical protein
MVQRHSQQVPSTMPMPPPLAQIWILAIFAITGVIAGLAQMRAERQCPCCKQMVGRSIRICPHCRCRVE